MDYNDFSAKAREYAQQLPEESDILYKRNFIQMPKEHLSALSEHDHDYEAARNEVEEIAKRIKDVFNIEFDIVVGGDYTYSNGADGVEITDMTGLDGKRMEYKEEKMKKNRFEALVSATSKRIISIRTRKGARSNYNMLFANVNPLSIQVDIDAAEGSEASIFQFCCSGNGGSVSALAISNDITVGENAKLDIVQMHNENQDTAVVNIHTGTVRDNGFLRQHFFYTGGAYVKAIGSIELTGNSAESETNETVLGSKEQKIDVNTEIINGSVGSLASLESKAALMDYSRCILKGFARIKYGAVGSRSIVHERGMLLDKTAKIDSLPGMSIAEDDVKATHSSSAAPIDDETLFYLGARGIDRKSADRLIVDGFLGNSIKKIRNPSILRMVAAIINGKIDTRDYGKLPAEALESMWLIDMDQKNEDTGERLLQEHLKYRKQR